ncbi:hypothetical protein VCHC50A2_1357A, partial [Vibrio cholerae HC-50A2]
MNFCPVIEAIH